MPKYEDKSIQIVEETVDGFGLRIGPETLYIEKQDLQRRIDGKVDTKELLLNNLAIRCSLSDLHVSDFAKIKDAAEKNTFKGPK